MTTPRQFSAKPARLLVAAATLGAGAVLMTGSWAGAATSSGKPSSPSTKLAVATVPKVGKVVVDARGRTVYVLTANGKSNVTCSDSTGCTKVWPDLPLPKGTKAATAGTGIQSKSLGTKKLSDGETYPTYHGWLMYEYVGDSRPGQANGQGIKSFGGTWYALGANGTPIKSTANASSSGGSSGSHGSSGSSGGGSGY